MPKTHLKAKAVDIGEVELGDHLFLIIEVDVDEERKKNTKTGTTETLYADVKDVLRLVGALPGELVEELRRQRREAEEKAAGIPIIPGLEGFLDASGVVVTEADVPEKESPKAEAVTSEPGSKAAPAIEVDVDVARWVELGVDVHNLRALAAEDPGEVSYTARLEELFAELNSLLEGDEVIEDGGEVIIIDVEGEIRTTIALPDIELVDDPEGEVEVTEPAESTEEPFEGYDLLDFDGIIEHVDSYLDADKAFGGGKPSATAFAYIDALGSYEHAHGNRPKVIAALRDRANLIEEELKTSEPDAPPAELAAPWETYDKDTADTIIGILKAKAEREGDDATRPLVGHVEAYETANKNRKGVLGRLGGIVSPPLPTGPDEDLNLAADDLIDRVNELEDDAQDDEVEP